MNIKTGTPYLWMRPAIIDWKLLLFLLLFLDVKLVVKITAIIIIYILRPDFKFGFRLKNPRLPLFYLLVIGIGIFNWLISGMTGQFNYDLVWVIGISFWGLSILAIHQVKLSVERNDPAIIHRTILVFFIINALVSLLVYAGIVWETGALNPYRYQGNFQKYFIGTGDYIKGITFDTSTTNAVLNAFGVIYFLFRGKNGMILLCMAILLLTGSNATNLLLCITLLFIFFFRSRKDQKSIIVVCLLMLVTFLVKISPQNDHYVVRAYQRLFSKELVANAPATPVIPITLRPDSILTVEEKKQKIAQLYMDSINRSLYERKKLKPGTGLTAISVTDFANRPMIPKDSIHTPKFQHRNDTDAIRKRLLQFVANHITEVPISSGVTAQPRLPGKIVALKQTVMYFLRHPVKIVTGTGIGNYSSKLAFRSTAMGISGGYPERYAYINKDFRSNHLDLYLYYFTKADELHSIGNSPNSTYDQLLGEYGLAGLLAFTFFYVGFFSKWLKENSYALPILLFLLGILFFDYWFEQLSFVVLFELLLLLNNKETAINLRNANN